MKAMFHDDDCGVLLDGDGKCPSCGFHPDMQSTGFREITSHDRLARAGDTVLGLQREPFKVKP